MSDRMRGDKRLSLDKASIVRLEKAGKQFEILVDPDLAWKHREGQEIDIADVIQGYTIFEDALKGTAGFLDSEPLTQIVLVGGAQANLKVEMGKLRITTNAIGCAGQAHITNQLTGRDLLTCGQAFSNTTQVRITSDDSPTVINPDLAAIQFG